jgi:cellulose synthase/poly-beta-1,6-N-acetylglucosamine synthase-like glycosyltransferase
MIPRSRPIASVLVPTYGRPDALARCLCGLAVQERTPNEVVVVVRPSDQKTLELLATVDLPTLRIVEVHVPGQVAALNRGLREATGELLAITDDDAVPRPDWLRRIVDHFEQDAKLGGVGGLDLVEGTALPVGRPLTVGKVQWFGRVIGNHHLGQGAPRPVEILKGANMSYRRAAIEGLCFDTRLRGGGSQINNDMAFSLAVQSRGFSLIYDPKVIVDHYPAARMDQDVRDRHVPEATMHIIHNETLVLLEHLSFPRRLAFAVWATLVGTRTNPGLIALIALLAQRDPDALSKLVATFKGRLEGWRTWRADRHRRPVGG